MGKSESIIYCSLSLLLGKNQCNLKNNKPYDFAQKVEKILLKIPLIQVGKTGVYLYFNIQCFGKKKVLR